MTGPCIRQIREEDAQSLFEAAESDAHAVVRPTHVVEKDGKIIGYLSMASIPMVLFWMHTKNAKGVDSYCVANFFENMFKNAGSNAICVPCNVKSPLRPLMDKVGYQCFGTFDLMIKPL